MDSDCPVWRELDKFLTENIATHSLTCDEEGVFVCTIAVYADLVVRDFTTAGTTSKSATSKCLLQAYAYLRALGYDT